MKTCTILTPCLALFLAAGCATRSISDSGYQSDSNARYHSHTSGYQGELNELDVLGIDRDPKITEEDIVKALDSSGHIKLRAGSNVMLVQSGAVYPDDLMVTALSPALNVTPFSGQPKQFDREMYHKALRLAAARGGCESIICYWGILESARQTLDSKVVSWVPLVGSIVPDEHQHMRIRLKVAIIDTRTGNWAMFSPDPFADQALSARLGRERSDQAQVNKLKQQAYASAAQSLLKTYAN